MDLMIVCYHYIRSRLPRRGIHGITPAFFSKQLDHIHRAGFTFISLEDLCDSIQDSAKRSLPQKSCLITFDDGLRESFENGYGTLRRKGIPGAFFVVSSVLKPERLLDVHRIHYLRSLIKDDSFLEKCGSSAVVGTEKISKMALKTQYPWDTEVSARLKYYLNFVIKSEERSLLLGHLLEEVASKSERTLARELYMTPVQVRELGRQKALGSHSHTHRLLASLSDTEIKSELQHSKRLIEKVSGQEVRCVSYPYGLKSSYDARVIRACKSLGLSCALTVVKGLNRKNNLRRSPFSLMRFDTNDVFGGKDSARYESLIYG